MKMPNKKFVSIAATLGLSVGLITGCGTPTTHEEEDDDDKKSVRTSGSSGAVISSGSKSSSSSTSSSVDSIGGSKGIGSVKGGGAGS